MISAFSDAVALQYLCSESSIDRDQKLCSRQQESEGYLCGCCSVVMEVMDRDLWKLLHEVTGFLRNSSVGDDQSLKIGTSGKLLPFRSACYENIYFSI